MTRKETKLVIEENLTSASKPFVYYQEVVNHSKAFCEILKLVNFDNKINEKDSQNLYYSKIMLFLVFLKKWAYGIIGSVGQIP